MSYHTLKRCKKVSRIIWMRNMMIFKVAKTPRPLYSWPFFSSSFLLHQILWHSFDLHLPAKRNRSQPRRPWSTGTSSRRRCRGASSFYSEEDLLLLPAVTRQVSISSTFTLNFFVQKCFAQLFSNYSFALNFFGEKISVQKLIVKYWWNLL